MRKEKPAAKEKRGAPAPPQSPEERARGLLLRLETDGPNPVNAAEELDRLQGRLERDGLLSGIRERVVALCEAWSETLLRGERARVWLTLVGAFGVKEQAPATARVAEDAGLPAATRVQACRVLAGLKGETATRALQGVVLSNGDAAVRAAAAEALAEIGDRSVRPALEALLEEDLPRAVWTAVNTAVDRLR